MYLHTIYTYIYILNTHQGTTNANKQHVKPVGVEDTLIRKQSYIKETLVVSFQ